MNFPSRQQAQLAHQTEATGGSKSKLQAAKQFNITPEQDTIVAMNQRLRNDRGAPDFGDTVHELIRLIKRHIMCRSLKPEQVF